MLGDYDGLTTNDGSGSTLCALIDQMSESATIM